MSSTRLAVIVLAANLTACALVGTTLLVARSGDEATAADSGPGPAPASTTPTLPPSSTPPSSTPSSSTPTSLPPTTPTATQPGVPAGFRAVSAPGGLTTLIPAGWPAKPQENRETAMQATDPAQPASFLRYGGSPAPAGSLQAVMTAGEQDLARRYSGYRRLAFSPGNWRGHQSLSWEFEFDTPAGRKHVSSIYWRVRGAEYVLYASALVTDWPTMKAIYTTALGATKP